MKRNFLKATQTLILVFLAIDTFSQEITIEGLKQEYAQAETSIDSLDIIVQIDDWFLYTDPDSFDVYMEKTREIAWRINDPYGKATYFHLLGVRYDLESKIDQAIASQLVALKISDSINYGSGRSYALNDLGNLYRSKGMLDSSLYYLNKLIDGTDDPIFRAIGYNGIALNYRSVGAYQEAVDAYQMVLEGVEGTERYDNRVYSNLGQVYEEMGQKDEAFKYYTLGLKNSFESDRDSDIALNWNRLGTYHLNNQDFDSAIYYLKLSGSLYRKLEETTDEFRVKVNIVEYYLGKRQLKSAKELLDSLETVVEIIPELGQHSFYMAKARYFNETQQHEQAVRLLTRLEERYSDQLYTNSLLDIYQLQSDSYEPISPLQSLTYFKRYKALEDSVKSANNKNYTAMVNVRYETAKKDREIQSLAQEASIQALKLRQSNSVIIITVITSLLLLISGLVLYQRRKIREKEKLSEAEQRLLRSQLNPHFIFNSMSSIQHYMLDKGPEKASFYIGIFSSLMRQILEHSREEFISVREEVKMIENYLELQKMRFKDQLSYKIEVDEELDMNYHGIPPMFSQPFLENSLEHGLFKDTSRSNEVTIQLSKPEEGVVSLVVTDTGVGMQETKVETAHHSLATKITKERLALYSSNLRKKFSFTASNLTLQNDGVVGFQVQITLPTKIIAG